MFVIPPYRLPTLGLLVPTMITCSCALWYTTHYHFCDEGSELTSTSSFKDVIPLQCYKCAASLANAGPEEILRSSCEEREVALLEYQAAQVAIQRCTALLNHYRLRLNTLQLHTGQYAVSPQKYHEEKNQCLSQVESGERELNRCRETCARTKAALQRADRTLTMAQRFCQIAKEPRQSHGLLLSGSNSPVAGSQRTALRRW
ncbi:hypothetical protein BDQ17DRAFT_1069641 [Cyathus striatus]|nr:hypothetical protein BDQ17DRAFT_1069641 [Cyathus striatus]